VLVFVDFPATDPLCIGGVESSSGLCCMDNIVSLKEEMVPETLKMVLMCSLPSVCFGWLS
jgi:hypothetical protein